MKRIVILLLTLISAIALAGCGKMIYPDLPNEAVGFEMGNFIDPNDDDASYGTIEYEGRTYIPYGTLGKSLHKKDLSQCIGYVIMDENSSSRTNLSDKSIRLYTLTGDGVHNYLLEYDTATNLMNQPFFWRAVDTQGENITTPDFIKPLEYAFWN